MSVSEQRDRIPIGVSSCLVGEKVRFDGGHKQNRYLLDTLGQYFAFRPFCPEVSIGLGVPRETIRLIDAGGKVEAVGNRNADLNVTGALVHCADEQQDWHRQIFWCGQPRQ